MNSNQILAIGIGECGNNVVSELKAQNGRLHAFYVNTSTRDLEHLTNVTNKHIFPFCDGAGGSRDRMKTIITQKENMFGLSDDLTAYPEQKIAYMFGSSGGGTNSGGMLITCGILNNIRPDMAVNLVIFLPFKNESRTAHENTIEFWNELSKALDEESPYYCPNIHSVYFIDNNKRSTKEEVNAECVKAFNKLFTMASSSKNGTVDSADVEKLLYAKGVSAIYSFRLPSSDLIECVNDEMEDSIFVVHTRNYDSIGLRIHESFDSTDENQFFTTFKVKQNKIILRAGDKDTTLILGGGKLNQGIIEPINKELKKKIREIETLEEDEANTKPLAIKLDIKKPKKVTEERKTIDELLSSGMDEFFKKIMID